MDQLEKDHSPDGSIIEVSQPRWIHQRWLTAKWQSWSCQNCFLNPLARIVRFSAINRSWTGPVAGWEIAAREGGSIFPVPDMSAEGCRGLTYSHYWNCLAIYHQGLMILI